MSDFSEIVFCSRFSNVMHTGENYENTKGFIVVDANGRIER